MWWFSKKKIEIYSPVDGEIIDLAKVSDEVFSTKMLGEGIAFIPTSNEVRSPMKGQLKTVFPTGHAYGIEHPSGVECLLHLGIDTVNLKGQGFEIMVKQDNKVKEHELLVKVNWDEIKSKVPSIHTPLVFAPNTMKDKKLVIHKTGKVKINELIATIE